MMHTLNCASNQLLLAQAGFTVEAGAIFYNGKKEFWACPINDKGEWNIYASQLPQPSNCISIQLNFISDCGNQPSIPCTQGSTSTAPPSAPYQFSSSLVLSPSGSVPAQPLSSPSSAALSAPALSTPPCLYPNSTSGGLTYSRPSKYVKIHKIFTLDENRQDHLLIVDK
jgi:hypothetical protein